MTLLRHPQVALLEHSCRAREKEIQRLKESLEDKVNVTHPVLAPGWG
jgi:hypothetical protein